MSQLGEKSKAATLPGPERKSGRAVFDQGRTVWEWQTATGVFERQVSDEQLARLENAGLQLVDQPSPNAGRAIYAAEQTGSQMAYPARKQAGRPARNEAGGALRQFLRRLVPST